MDSIGFVGLGRMGAPMATRLLDAGVRVFVHNRTAEKQRPLEEKGATGSATPREAVPASDGIVMTMVADDRALEAVCFGSDGLIGALGEGGVHVSLSTVSPDAARRIADAHAAKGARYVAAPVFGRPDAAAGGKLWVVLSGDPDARARAKASLLPLSQGHYEVGDDVTQAHVVKLAGNFMLASAIETMSEAFAFVEGWGLSREQVAELFGSSLFSCPPYQNYGKAIAEHRYEPAGFAMSLGLKDVELALAASRDKGVPLPVASLIRDRLLASLARGRADLDWSALGRLASDDAGL